MNTQASPVEIELALLRRVEIEQVSLDRGPPAHGGAHADVGDPPRESTRQTRLVGVPCAARAIETIDEHRINAIGGEQFFDARQVGGGKAQGSPPLIAAHDGAGERVRTTEDREHIGEIPAAIDCARPGCWTKAPLVAPRWGGPGGKAHPLSQPHQLGEITGARLTEPEVGPHEDPLGRELVDQDLARKLSGVNAASARSNVLTSTCTPGTGGLDELDLPLERREHGGRGPP